MPMFLIASSNARLRKHGRVAGTCSSEYGKVTKATVHTAHGSSAPGVAFAMGGVQQIGHLGHFFAQRV
ncbi:hypothetical protein [Hydrogenophaga pseudoflava]|uniref:hypothetical protein n=1 Tax=Hydrogenophaga pseudoflava TaxID=47421 RepID=UPI0027E58C18|nr:hypothetical protein [Hydrogenophaga pseudoflava]MDQ7743221.1 hypothetical protein [Hydrogenophaga pseudoflava]